MTDLPLEIQVPQMPQNASAQMGERFHTEFYLKPIEDRAASMAAGHKVYRDEEWVIITLPGSKDAHHAPVAKKLKEWEFGVWQGQQMVKPPAPWAIQAYNYWKQGMAIPENGLALRHWPPATPAFIKTAQSIGCRTVEDLAALNDDGLRRLGPGALNWKRTAVEYLKGANASNAAERLATQEGEIEALKETNVELQRTVKALEEQIRAYAAGQVPQAVPQVHVPPPYPEQNATGTPLPPQTVTTAQTPMKTLQSGYDEFETPDHDAADRLELQSLREEYRATFGKKPPGFLKAETLRRKIDEAQGQ